MSVLKSIAQKLGLDKSIAYSSGARIVQAIAGIGNMFFISSFLTGIEQGFFFTFGSILALQVFFELGLTGIMTQYVAYEVSHLELDSNLYYCGEKRYKDRLSSLIRFCVKWYSLISILVFIVLFAAGFVYFNVYGNCQEASVEWKLPWLLVSLSTALKLFQSPFSAILTGLGFVKEQSKIIFYQQLIQPISIWIGLFLGIKLYVLGVSYLLAIILWMIMSSKMKQIKILKNLLQEKPIESVSYMKEIFPYQWRIALSWISGYFTFQLFNPVLFATEGAVVAGQMGMTLQALNAISAFSMSWLNTKIPLYSSLIAVKDYFKLDIIFSETLKQMKCICLSLLAFLYILVIVLNISHVKFAGVVLSERFLGPIPMLFMVVPIYLQQFINSWAVYLRCHKKEPYLLLSIFGGITSLLSTLVLGRYFGLYGVVIGYCTIVVISLPWAYNVYKRCKLLWH